MSRITEAFRDELQQLTQAFRRLVLLIVLSVLAITGAVLVVLREVDARSSGIPHAESTALDSASSPAADRPPDAHTEVAPTPEEGPESLARPETSLPEAPIDDAPLQALANARLLGDRFLREGAVEAAVRQYRTLTSDDTPETRYRLSLCAEVLGELRPALEGYRQVVDAEPPGELLALAQLGQARVLRALGLPADAQLALSRWILQSDIVRPLSQVAAADALYLLGAINGELPLPERPLWHATGVCRPVWAVEPARLLPATVERPAAEGQTRDEATELSGLQIAHRLADSDPDAISLNATTGPLAVRQLVEWICETCGWTCDWSSEADLAVRGRTSRVSLRAEGVGQILDALLVPLELEWLYADGRLAVRLRTELDADALRRLQWARAERTLLGALIAEPNHHQAANAYLLLGNLSFVRGCDDQSTLQAVAAAQPADASEEHRDGGHRPSDEFTEDGTVFPLQSLNRPRSGHLAVARRHFRHIIETEAWAASHAEAWFNLAKIAQTESNLEEAYDAMLRAMDAGPGHPLEPAAHLIAGQQRLALDRPREATRPLRRAVALATDVDIHSQAVLLLAAAHLLDGNPQAAALGLTERHDPPLRDRYRDRGAVLSSLARYRAAATPRLRSAAAEDLLASLSHGDLWSDADLAERLLVLEASQELGLSEVILSTLSTTARGNSPSPLQTRLDLVIVDGMLADGRLDAAETLLAEIEPSAPDAAVAAVQLRHATLLAERGHPGEVSRICQAVLQQTTTAEIRASALRLWGQASFRQGDHERAALCFSGIDPTALNLVDPPPAGSARNPSTPSGAERTE